MLKVSDDESDHERTSLGIPGLDDILGGGVTKDRVYLVEGTPGTGKTTLSLQFLLEGVKCADSGLYITLSETKLELKAVAATHGWSLDKISFLSLSTRWVWIPTASRQYCIHPK